MADLSKEFLKQAISNLNSLQDQVSQDGSKILSEDFLKHYFQKLHTLKGSSQTFNFNNLAILAHEIENLLQVIQSKQISQDHITNSIFIDGFNYLIETAESYLQDLQPADYREFFSRIRNLSPNLKDLPEFHFSQNSLPQNILEKLSAQESSNLNSAMQNNKNLYILEANYALSDFYHGFKSLKKALDNRGQVIAILPNSSKNTDRMSLQILYSTDLRGKKTYEIFKSFSAKILFESDLSQKHFPNNISEMLNDLINIGKKKSFQLNKNITFELFLADIKISNKYLLLLNEIGSHLLNNAIDHAIEPLEERLLVGKSETATIKVSISNTANHLQFIVEDDGRGIDLSKSDHKLPENEALDLIFKQGFSTNTTVSEISGRGVGLAAVKDLVENSKGKIEVETNVGHDTKFTVYLPLD